MSLYIVVEGRRTEKKVYQAWLNLALPGFAKVATPSDVAPNSYYLISGNGYPRYIETITAAIADIKDNHTFNRLIVAVDSEELAFDERYAEILKVVEAADCHVPVNIIVQNPCIESWFLGNKAFIRTNPSQSELNQFLSHFDVCQKDPEQLPIPEGYSTKASYHLAYFKEACRERDLSYSKRRPGEVLKRHYLDALAQRFDNTGHIPSFGALLRLFRELGAAI